MKEYEKISKSPATPEVLKYLGVSAYSDNKTDNSPTQNKSKSNSVSKERSTKLTPPLDASSKDSKLLESSANNKTDNASEANTTASLEKKPLLVLSSRIKPIEEVVVINKDVDKENNDDNKLVSRAPAGLDWLQRTLRRSRSDYHQPQQQPPAQRPGRRHTSSNLIQVPTRDT